VLIKVAKDFTDSPGGRHRSDGKWSGEEFRQDWLEAPVGRGERVTIDFDGAFGYATSFLDEVFGGLARKYGAKKVSDLLDFISEEDPELPERVRSYMINRDV